MSKKDQFEIYKISNVLIITLRMPGLIILTKDLLGLRFPNFELIFYFIKYVDCSQVVQIEIWKDPNYLLFILKMTGLLKQGHNSNKGTFEATIYTKMLDVEENRNNAFSQNCKKSSSQILDMLFIELFWCTDQNILAGAVGAHPLLAPGAGALKTRFLPILGQKIFEIQKFFFPQISLFIGPIDGLSNIFWSGLPFWLYIDS